MPRYTLGLCTMGNSSAALFIDGKLIAAVEEERLTRIKNDSNFPICSITEVLSIAKINFQKIDNICIYWKPFLFYGRLLATIKKIFSNPKNSFILIERAFESFFYKSSKNTSSSSWSDLFFIKILLKKSFGEFKAKINFIDHHLSHQLYADTMHDWKEYISLSYDGGGEVSSSVLCLVKNGNKKIISIHSWPNSLGHFYSTFTGFLGFKMLEGEYKMMGLAPYGKPIFKNIILEKILKLLPDGKYKLNTSICDYHAALQSKYSAKMKKLFGEPRIKNQKVSSHHVDLAASVQAAYEEALIHLISPAIKQAPDVKRIVLSGGCALNVTANGKLISSKLFDEIIIPPAPHDAGCASGACIPLIIENIDIQSVRNPYTGRIYGNKEILEAFKKFNISNFVYLDNNDLTSKISFYLAEKKIIAWFQGASEFGPRALGNRSYLADPRKDEIRDEINEKIKKRELFRPFAPSVTQEDSKDFFSLNQHSPYMNIVSEVINKKIPAITHIDNTARIHTVSKQSNPLYYELIKKFGELTGVPVLLNTSFNIQEPIVYSPQNAISTFLSSEVDVLVIGNYVLLRKNI